MNGGAGLLTPNAHAQMHCASAVAAAVLDNYATNCKLVFRSYVPSFTCTIVRNAVLRWTRVAQNVSL